MCQTDGPDNDTMVGRLSIFSQLACALFDISTTLSFMSHVFANKCGMLIDPADMVRVVKSPLGVNESIGKMCKNVDIVVANKQIPIDLVMLNMNQFNVILGMD